MTTQATPVIGHGTNNLDTGFDLSEASQSDVFMDLANDMLGITNEDTETDGNVGVDEETEVDGNISDNEELGDDTDDTDVTDNTNDTSSDDNSNNSEDVDSKDESDIYVIKLDGEELEVTEDELLSGYQRQRDYTKKTQELSESRKELQSHIDALTAERTKYTTALDGIINTDSKQLEEYSKLDWNGLRNSDPQKFLLLQYEMTELRDSIQAKSNLRTDALNSANSNVVEEHNKFLDKEGGRVKDMVEGWGGEGHTKLMTDLRSQSVIEGFIGDDDEKLLEHAVVIKLLQKAKLYDDLKITRDNVVNKKIKRKVPRVIRSGNKNNVSKSDNIKQHNNAMERLKQTGNIKDSISLFAEYIK